MWDHDYSAAQSSQRNHLCTTVQFLQLVYGHVPHQDAINPTKTNPLLSPVALLPLSSQKKDHSARISLFRCSIPHPHFPSSDNLSSNRLDICSKWRHLERMVVSGTVLLAWQLDLRISLQCTALHSPFLVADMSLQQHGATPTGLLSG